MTKSNETTRRSVLNGILAGGVAATAATAARTSTPPQGRFAGKHVLITGATSGMGEVTARAFAREGAFVSFNGRRAELGQSVAASINADPQTQAAGGRAL